MKDPSTKVKFKLDGVAVTTSYFPDVLQAKAWAEENTNGEYELKQ